MQFAYQFPERTGRLVLVSSGGLGREVNVLLRAAALPGAEIVLPFLAPRWLGPVLGRLEDTGSRLGMRTGPDLAEMVRGFASLTDKSTRWAFLHTLRGVIDPLGQRVSGRDRLYLAENLPTLVVWGGRDPIIPARHGLAAHEAMPGSRFECFHDAGHFPQLNDPERFADVLRDFLRTTRPARLDTASLSARLRSGVPAAVAG
jgi:pimeloyl-ACP methyl ester carboxylesterase